MPPRRDPELVLDDGALTIPVAGDFDMATTFTVEPKLERAADLEGLRRLTLDLSGVTFLDSTGLGVVMRLASELQARGTDLEIVPGPPEVQRVFETAGLADALPFSHERRQG
jgi:anti-anti-sigma factor